MEFTWDRRELITSVRTIEDYEKTGILKRRTKFSTLFTKKQTQTPRAWNPTRGGSGRRGKPNL
jgi:hypothetical protein